MRIDKKQYSTKIDIAKLSATIISSRNIAKALEETIKKTNTELVILDFSDVKFVSRSAAHSLLVLKERLWSRVSNKKRISFMNTSNDITEMFRIVAANRALPKNENIKFNPEKIDIKLLLKQTV
jgi:anti-anti-sigma regulatory factor